MPDLPQITSPRETMSRLARFGLKPRRGMGQNFLIDGNTVNKITAALAVKPGDAVVEVGPGAGAMTTALVHRGARIFALELDSGMVRLLKDLFNDFPAVTIVQGDALQVNWPVIITEHFKPGETVKLVSNLPYNISSPFLYALCKHEFPFSEAVLMFQKEVAQRVTALPGSSNYSGLSVICQYYSHSDLLFQVSRQVFWPRPTVDSAVIMLKPQQRRLLDKAEEPYFWKVVQGVFQQRRKTMVNGLFHTFSWPKDVIADLLKQASIDPSARPELVSVGEFANLSRIIYNYTRITRITE